MFHNDTNRQPSPLRVTARQWAGGLEPSSSLTTAGCGRQYAYDLEEADKAEAYRNRFIVSNSTVSRRYPCWYDGGKFAALEEAYAENWRQIKGTRDGLFRVRLEPDYDWQLDPTTCGYFWPIFLGIVTGLLCCVVIWCAHCIVRGRGGVPTRPRKSSSVRPHHPRGLTSFRLKLQPSRIYPFSVLEFWGKNTL